MNTPAKPDDRACWVCGSSGHLRGDFPLIKLKTRCLRCNKSFHWAKDCYSPAEVPPDRVFLSPTSKRKPCKSKDYLGAAHLFVDGQSVKRLVDTVVDATVLTKTAALHFLHWKHKAAPPPISGVGGQLDSKFTTHPGHWKDLDGNQGPTHPITSTVPKRSVG